MKWVVTAEYGGTGGRPLEAGMIIEEPDIEIGAGVSSKAISQKIHLRPKTQSRGKTQQIQGNNRQQGGNEGFPQAGMPPGFPSFPMMPEQQGMFAPGQYPQGQFPPGQFPPFMMPPQMQAFFQQQFGGMTEQQQGQEGFAGYGEQQGHGGQQQSQ